MIVPATWRAIHEDYVTGKGSLAVLALKHGLRTGTVERRAGNEGWTRQRNEFEVRHRARLLPPLPPVPPPAPAVVGGAVSEEWLRERQARHYRDTARLLDLVRGNLEKLIAATGEQSPEAIRNQASALGHLAETEARLLGLRDRGKKAPKEPEQRDKRWNRSINEIIVGLASGTAEGEAEHRTGTVGPI